MNCATARELLSAFHDRELVPALAAEVQDHVQGCANCARVLDEYSQMSRMAAELRTPAIPASAWPDLGSRLDDEDARQPVAASRASQRRRRVLSLAVAASLVVAAVAGSLLLRRTAQDARTREHAAVAATFGRYLSAFQHDPEQAQEVLVTSYDGQAVDLEEAARRVRYQPVAPSELPGGFTRDRVYVLRMACCDCVQTIYRSKSGARLVMFEHVDDQPAWFADRPTIRAQCHGMPTSLVQVDDCLAATWKLGRRYITVIGASDVEQVSQLVAFLDAASATEDRRDS